jgi:predicted double-glycine peptidase
MRTTALLLAGVLALAQPAFAQGMALPIPGAGEIRVRVESLSDERFAHIVRQSTDYSCGAASVATILRYAYGLDATEDGTIRGMLAVSDANEVRERGFSLLDIKNYITSIGFSGAGYRLPSSALFTIRVPVIALLEIDGYSHFVVLKATDPNYAYVADPMLGNRRIETSRFLDEWNGIIFVIASRSYATNNPLVELQRPLPFNVMSDSVPTASAALSDAQLLSVYIPAMTRI